MAEAIILVSIRYLLDIDAMLIGAEGPPSS